MARKQEYSVRTRQCESGGALPLFLWGCLCCTVLLTFGDMGELVSFCHTFWVMFSLWSSAVLLVKHQNRSRVHQACVSHGLTTTGGQEDHTNNNQSDALKKILKKKKNNETHPFSVMFTAWEHDPNLHALAQLKRTPGSPSSFCFLTSMAVVQLG